MGRQLNQIIEGLSGVTAGTSTINVNLDAIEALLTTLQADVADGIIVSSGTANTNLRDGAGNAITSTVSGSSRRLDVMLSSGGATGSAAPTNANLVGGTDGTNLRGLSVDSSGRLNTNINGTVPVSGTFWQATQPVSGTVTQNVTPALLTSYNQAGVIAINTILMTLDNSIYQSISIQCSSMGTTGVVTAEWSNDNTNWLSTPILNRDSSSFSSSFSGTGMWTSPALARYFRLRLSTATTGGTTTLSVYQFNDTRQLWLSTQPVSGAVSQSGVPNSSNGTSTFHTAISAASTNATSVKTTNANIGSIHLANTTASLRYFKLFNSTSAPTVGTSTPVLNYTIQPNSSMSVDCGWAGIRLSSGLAYAITAGQALLDNTAVGAGDVVVNIAYA